MENDRGFISADYKAEGGKLLRVRLKIADHAIQSIKITGDFFMHPEESIEDLEAMLTGTLVDEPAIRAKVQDFFKHEVEVIGAGVEDFVSVILMAH